MKPAPWMIRRATVEDLPALRVLWLKCGLPVGDLEKRLTEFQVAVAVADGRLAGAVALERAGPQGLCHSEAIADPEASAAILAALWARIQTLAANLGLARLWKRGASEFWDSKGFRAASPDELSRLPPHWAVAGCEWRTLPLREETAERLSLEKEFELFQQAQREETERMMRRARLFKTVVLGTIALAVLALALLLLKDVFRKAGGSLP